MWEGANITETLTGANDCETFAVAAPELAARIDGWKIIWTLAWVLELVPFRFEIRSLSLFTFNKIWNKTHAHNALVSKQHFQWNEYI